MKYRPDLHNRFIQIIQKLGQLYPFRSTELGASQCLLLKAFPQGLFVASISTNGMK